jgi:hypothetical protein
VNQNRQRKKSESKSSAVPLVDVEEVQAIPMYFDRRVCDLRYVDSDAIKGQIKARVKADIARVLEASGFEGQRPAAPRPSPAAYPKSTTGASSSSTPRPFVATVACSRPVSGGTSPGSGAGGGGAGAGPTTQELCEARAEALMRAWEKLGLVEASPLTQVKWLAYLALLELFLTTYIYLLPTSRFDIPIS